MEIVDKELHRVVVSVIVYREDGRFLLIKRSPNKKVFPNKWHPPGGGLEVDDYINSTPDSENQWYNSLEKTLIREVKEETNLEVGEPEYLTNLTFIRPDGIPVLTLVYYCQFISGEVKLDPDNVDYKWLDLEEVREYDLINGIFGELQEVDNLLKARK
jgi:8-oxo-dGTP diphosphatase